MQSKPRFFRRAFSNTEYLGRATFAGNSALPAPNPEGPFPSHLHVQPGDRSLEQMLASMDRGLWVSRFHYGNPIPPLETKISGMTPDGAWWVQRGEARGSWNEHWKRLLGLLRAAGAALYAAERLGVVAGDEVWIRAQR